MQAIHAIQGIQVMKVFKNVGQTSQSSTKTGHEVHIGLLVMPNKNPLGL